MTQCFCGRTEFNNVPKVQTKLFFFFGNRWPLLLPTCVTNLRWTSLCGTETQRPRLHPHHRPVRPHATTRHHHYPPLHHRPSRLLDPRFRAKKRISRPYLLLPLLTTETETETAMDTIITTTRKSRHPRHYHRHHQSNHSPPDHSSSPYAGSRWLRWHRLQGTMPQEEEAVARLRRTLA